MMYQVPPDAWRKLEQRLRELADHAVPDPAAAFRDTDPLISLALGKWLAAAAKIERRFVTVFGAEAPRLVEPFFHHCLHLKGFWHMRCTRRRRDGSVDEYTVKVVLSVNTLNSTLMSRIRREARSLHKPVILAMTGRGRRDVEPAVFMDGPATWTWLAQEHGAYQKWLDLLYNVFMEKRRLIRREFQRAWNEWLEKTIRG